MDILNALETLKREKKFHYLQIIIQWYIYTYEHGTKYIYTPIKSSQFKIYFQNIENEYTLMHPLLSLHLDKRHEGGTGIKYWKFCMNQRR